jgi:hypothetical protein
VYTYRELEPHEFDLAPRAVPGAELYTPENSRILAAFNEAGEVVSTWTMFLIPHIEPFWIREDHRHSPSVMRRMTESMKAMIKELGFPAVYTVVKAQTPVLRRFAKWFGAKEVDGTLFYWVAPKEQTPCQQQ